MNPLWFLLINKGLLKPLLLRWISSECDIYHARFCWPICGTAVMAFLVNELLQLCLSKPSVLRKVNARWTPNSEQYHLINELHWVSTKPHRSGLAAGDSQGRGVWGHELYRLFSGVYWRVGVPLFRTLAAGINAFPLISSTCDLQKSDSLYYFGYFSVAALPALHLGMELPLVLNFCFPPFPLPWKATSKNFLHKMITFCPHSSLASITALTPSKFPPET